MGEIVTLKDVMVYPSLTVGPEKSVRQAARLMEQFGCTFLPVVRNGMAIGVVTATDLALRTLVGKYSPESVPVRQIMSSPALGLCEDSEVEDASILMRRAGVKRLIVKDHVGHLLGVVGLRDLAEYVDDSSIAKTVRKLGDRDWGYSTGSIVRIGELQ